MLLAGQIGADPFSSRVLAGDLGHGERAARQPRHRARTAERGHQLRPDRRHGAVRLPAGRGGLQCDFRHARRDRAGRVCRRAGDRQFAAETATPRGAASWRRTCRCCVSGSSVTRCSAPTSRRCRSRSPCPSIRCLLAQLRLCRGHLRPAAGVACPGGHRARACIAGRFVRTGPQTLWPVMCAVGGGGVASASCRRSTTWRRSASGCWWSAPASRRHDALLPDHDLGSEPARGARLRARARRHGLERFAPQHAAHDGLPRRPLRHRRPAFYVLGASPSACALLIAWMRRWAFRQALNIPGSSEWRSSRR